MIRLPQQAKLVRECRDARVLMLRKYRIARPTDPCRLILMGPAGQLSAIVRVDGKRGPKALQTTLSMGEGLWLTT